MTELHGLVAAGWQSAVSAEKTIFLRKLGQLSAADLLAVRTTWSQHMTF